MLSDKIQNALNDQLNFELYSGYIYLSMAAWFEEQNLPGFANWMKIQALEEQAHAAKFFSYINERSGRVRLAAIEAPDFAWESALAAFEDALAHERIVTGRIGDLVALSRDERDFATENFLQWFIAEQVEEEAAADEIIQSIALSGGDGQGLFMVDRELGKRVFALPAGVTVPGLPAGA